MCDISGILNLVDIVDFMNFYIYDRYMGDITDMFYMVEIVNFSGE